MSLRFRLYAFLGTVTLVTVAAAIWEIHAYEVARAKIVLALPQDQQLVHVGDQLAVTIALVAVIDLVTLCLAWYFGRKWIMKPLGRMRKDLTRVTHGEKSIAIRSTGPMEIAQAAAAAEQMRRSLVNQIELTKSANESLGSDAPVTNELRTALTPKFSPKKVLPVIAAAYSTAAQGVATGDWWDIFTNDQSDVVVLVDVEGHDAAAAIAGLQSKSVFGAAISAGFDIHRMVQAFSRTLSEVEVKVLSAFVMEIPKDLTKPVRWISAGHPAAFLFDAKGNSKLLTATGPLLAGIGDTWDIKQFLFEPGMRIVIASDGLLELRNPNHEFFESQGVISAMQKLHLPASPEQIISQVVADMKFFAAPSNPEIWEHEDVTVVAIARESK